ncbi:MAG: hypothetical protein NC182_04665 [Prevotella sp.]|nr:hypothetical protein [Staphylococcus sp.]MCM1350476.1 hypothetical protein [Prevotella sp.]
MNCTRIRLFSKIVWGIICVTCIPFLMSQHATKAESMAKLYMVFDKMSYNSGEEVHMTINLDHFVELSEVKLQIKLKSDYFEPVLTEGQYFYFNNSSIFQNILMNDYVDESYLRLRLIKNKEIQDGYYSGYRNNICYLTLRTKRPILDIRECFTLENYETMGTSVYLFNTKDDIIPFEIFYKEKMKIEWSKENYVVDVFGEVPQFKNDIQIMNRNLDEYEYLIEKQIDTNMIGIKTIHVGIYDKLTADYVFLSKPIQVVDRIAPLFTYPSSIQIEDEQVRELDLLHYIQVSDNYDSYLDVKYNYYTDTLEKIEGFEAFLAYLEHHLLAYVAATATDSSGNTAVTEQIELRIKDTNAPSINIHQQIEILDVNIDELDIVSYFQIADEYDDNPRLVLDMDYNDIELKQVLKTGERVSFSYFAIDASGNMSETYSCEIIPIDTIPPVISGQNLRFLDIEFVFSAIQDSIVVTDNFSFPCTSTQEYVILENNIELLLSQQEFEKAILRGKKGYIRYWAVDHFGNKSESFVQHIEIVDTTVPVIYIKGIEEGKKYIKVEQIQYEIIENFDGYESKVWLDNQSFDPILLEKLAIGDHLFYIEVVDQAGNRAQKEIHFTIIEDNVIGCYGDIDCYVTNYLEIVIIAATLIVFVIVIILTKIFSTQKKYRKQKEKM